MIGGVDGKGVAICPLDQRMMSFGEKGMGTIDPFYVPTTPLASVSMFNNLWTINFPYWIKGNVHSRVRVWATENLKPSSLVEPALESLNPPLVAVSSASGGKLPAYATGLTLSRPGIVVAQCASASEGRASILRLWEYEGRSGPVTVTLPAGAKFNKTQPINLRGEPSGEPIEIRSDRLNLNLPAYSPASVLLEW